MLSLAPNRPQTSKCAAAWFTAAPALFIALLGGLLDVSTGRAQERIEVVRASQLAATELTAELIDGTLSTQLVRLEENGLAHMPLYSEIESLRAQLSRASKTEMAEILSLLMDGPSGSQPANVRLAKARNLARQLVIQLMVERQRVRKRLRVARTSSMVEHLIEAQAATRRATQRLQAEGSTAVARQSAAVLQDQHDIGVLLAQLMDTLDTIAAWGGLLGETSAVALEICERADVVAASARAEDRISKARFHDAEPEQDQILNALYAALRALERAQGLAAMNRAAALRLSRRLLTEQQELRNLSQNSNLDHRDRLGARQRAIHRELLSLGNMVRHDPDAFEEVGKAQRASANAEQALFQGDNATATAQQGNVLRALQSIEQRLSATPEAADTRAASSSEWQTLDKAVDEALQMQSRVAELASTNVAEAANLEREVAERLETPPNTNQSESIRQQLDAARDAARNAEEALRQSADSKTRSDAISAAEEALMELAAEIKSNFPGSETEANSSTAQPPSENTNGSPRDRQTDNSKQSQAEESTSKENASGSQDENTKFDSRAADREADTRVTSRTFRDSPWLIRLPASLKQAIQARSRREPPSQYSERLERYFRD